MIFFNKNIILILTLNFFINIFSINFENNNYVNNFNDYQYANDNLKECYYEQNKGNFISPAMKNFNFIGNEFEIIPKKDFGNNHFYFNRIAKFLTEWGYKWNDIDFEKNKYLNL